MTVRLRRASENAVIYDGERIVVNNRQKYTSCFQLTTNAVRSFSSRRVSQARLRKISQLPFTDSSISGASSTSTVFALDCQQCLNRNEC